jgi:hypothetical protein
MNDPAYLRKLIAELESENKKLKLESEDKPIKSMQ